MKKFCFAFGVGSIWLLLSIYLSIGWANDISKYLPNIYVWWVIIGIALLPGFLMSTMFTSNLLHMKKKQYPDTDEATTIIMCARNEEKQIKQAIQSIFSQNYQGNLRLLVIDNASTDQTKEEILKLKELAPIHCELEYVYCEKLGKTHALNMGLELVQTSYFITVDADTCLEENAVQMIMNHIVACKCACVAGNLFVHNVHDSWITKIQTYDYLLSIAAIKRFQGSYQSTLVAQGAFSAYHTEETKKIGGWKDVFGEDIVLTYQFLEQGLSSTYEPKAVGYTTVPQTISSLYLQRKRWAIGMFEGFSTVLPWQQGNLFSKCFAFINLSIIYLDAAYLFGFIPGVILAICGYPYFVGLLTIATLLVCVCMFSVIYFYQKQLKISFEDSLIGFIGFLIYFQVIQSIASLDGYVCYLLGRKRRWK